MLGNDDVLPLSQHSIFYIGTGKKKMLAMWDCERMLVFLGKEGLKGPIKGEQSG